ncbi:hypothetical protein AAVH_19017 [Aphelenchoides avenae]|nr:hypothetical protein AAVH_19017 [Aphelenchus avenae]
MKYEVDESTDLSTTEPPSSKKRDLVCPLCQEVYNTKSYYRYHRKREFIAHLIKAHDCSHLRGYCRQTQCKCCKTKRERWTFVVRDGNKYKFSDVCSRCQGYVCRLTTDDSDGQQYRLIKNQHRQSITSLWKNFTAHQESIEKALKLQPRLHLLPKNQLRVNRINNNNNSETDTYIKQRR